jgi:hypothetical protein
MSITRAQIATQLLNKMAPKGEKLAYINNREAELLKRMGGAGIDVNGTGIKSYVNFGSGRGSVSEDLNQAAFGSSGPTFSSDGGSESFTPKGNFATITKGGNDTQRTIPENYFTPSKTGTNIARVANFLLNPRMISKKIMDDKIKEQYEKELQVAKDVITPRNTGYGQAIGSQYFGKVNNAMMQSYKNVVGGFPNTDPFVDTGGGDNQIIPRMQMIAEAPSDVESTSSDFDLYAALEGREGMRFGENPYGIMGVTQRFAGGGEVRQAYGLGKLVKKATRAVKKVVKSDIGKAALIAAGTYALGGGGNPFTAAGRGKFDFMNIPGYSKAKNFIGNNSMMKDINKLPGYVKYGIPAAMLATYGAAKKEEPDDLDQEIAQNYTDNSGLKELLASLPKYRFQVQKPYQLAAYGGRIGYEIGGDIDPADLPMSREGFPRYEDESGEEVPYPYNNQEMASNPDPMAELFQMYLDAIGSGKIPRSTTFEQFKELMSSSSINESMDDMSLRENANLGGIMGYAYGPQNYRQMAAEGGRINFSNGGGSTKYIKDVLTKKGYQDMMQNMNDNEIRSLYDSVMGTFSRRFAEGGMIDLGGMEKDYRAEGGFVPIGGKEKADDVPARLSKNEFVFTADAVRNAGGGDVDKGAEVMYNVMKNLESGGKISEKSQGLQGARNMFQTSQKLGEIL